MSFNNLGLGTKIYSTVAIMGIAAIVIAVVGILQASNLSRIAGNQICSENREIGIVIDKNNPHSAPLKIVERAGDFIDGTLKEDLKEEEVV